MPYYLSHEPNSLIYIRRACALAITTFDGHLPLPLIQCQTQYCLIPSGYSSLLRLLLTVLSTRFTLGPIPQSRRCFARQGNACSRSAPKNRVRMPELCHNAYIKHDWNNGTADDAHRRESCERRLSRSVLEAVSLARFVWPWCHL